MTQDEKQQLQTGAERTDDAPAVPPGRRIEIDDPRLTPAMRAALIRSRAQPAMELTTSEKELARKHLDDLGPDFQFEHAGRVVSIEPLTGRYALGKTAIDSMYAFEQAHGPARLYNIMLGSGRLWGL